jgi:hypothetical protein
MTSLINPTNIDVTYPIAGQDNDTQGFRTNFTNIKSNFVQAATEISGLQANVTNLQEFGTASFSFVPATGTVQANAYPITTQTVSVSSVTGPSAGIVLPVPTYAGQQVYVDANGYSINLYPSLGGQIDEAGTNAPITLIPSAYWIGVCEQVSPPVWASFVGQFTGNSGQISTTYINGGVTIGLANNVTIPQNLTVTGALIFANLTTTQINAITPTSPGMTVYNYNTGNIQVYNGTKWANITLS